MAKIKCIYFLEPRCQYGDKVLYDICMDRGTESVCSYFKPDRDDVINPDCANLRYPRKAFEGEYKAYELDDYGLRVGKNKHIEIDDIDYLEIDGKEVKFEYDCGGRVIKWDDGMRGADNE